MLRTLLESNAPRQRRRGSAATSVAAHTLVIAAAVVATASADSAAVSTERPIEPSVVYARPAPRADQPAAESRPRTRRAPEPCDCGFPPLVRIPDVIPSSLPGFPELDPTKALASDEGHRSDGRPGFDPWAAGLPPGPIGDEPATLATVEQPAALLAPPRPRYPEQLRAAGVTGRVIVRLIVDTTGRVERASVVIRDSSHELFSQAVRAVLPSLRFAPAQVGGRRVRMLVDLPFEFRLNE